MKVFIGKVISTKGDKTAIVEVSRLVRHPLYEKRVKKSKRYPVHKDVEVKEGDVVKFRETRPISRTKRWGLVQVLEEK